MRVRVAHVTGYRFDASVHLEPHVLRLRPRSDGSQRLIDFELAIEPTPAGRADCLDQDGNVATQVWFDAPATGLRVSARFEVEPLRENPFDFLPPVEGAAVPIAYAEPWRTMLAPYARAHGGPGVEEFATEIAGACGGRAMPFLATLASRLYEDWRPVRRETGDPLAATDTLAAREGSCRDLAVLFCETCRAAGFAARFVSGYERASATAEQPAMHAWAEVYLPGGGWRGYDPSRGVAVATNHVAVAAAAVPSMAAPIAGSYRGSATSAMEVAIRMEIGA
jgi:transglutaminase-like putative cysteine protease